MGVTVLTVEGLDFGVVDRMPRMLRGFATAEGRVRERVRFPASASGTSVATGVQALDQAIRRTSGEKIVLAHSQGAQVASEWLRGFAGRPDAPPAAELSFILLGNVQRRLGARLGGPGLDAKPLRATPDDTQYRVLDVARRWDGWANADNWPERLTTGAKAKLVLGRMFDHLRYEDVDVDGEANLVRGVVGNTTYVVAP